MSLEPLRLEWYVDADHCICVQGKNCLIWLEPRPPYCDRGNWIAKIFTEGAFSREVDNQDGWPRYYFELMFAQREIEAWLVRRNQNRV